MEFAQAHANPEREGSVRSYQEVVVFITTSSEEEATRIGRSLIDAELAACANILRGVTSIFRWHGRISQETETMMVVKTRLDLFDELAGMVRQLHSYQVPEIIALPIVKGTPAYLDWIVESTRKSMKS